MDRKSKRGFSLVEIIVVVAIIALLTFMAVPAFNKVRQTSKNKVVLNNLKVIATAGKEYILENDVSQVDYSSLEGKYFPTIRPIAGEVYTGLNVAQTNGTLSVTQADGTTITFDY